MKAAAVVVLASALLAVGSPTPEADRSDWKYAVGWDGVTLPATDIGAVLPGNGTSLEKRNIGGVYICTDINWGGRCGYAVQPLGECIVLGSDWNQQISSFGPDECTYCEAYASNNCYFYIPGGSPSSIPVWSFTNPGSATGGLDTNNPWNDRISSFICSKNC